MLLSFMLGTMGATLSLLRQSRQHAGLVHSTCTFDRLTCHAAGSFTMRSMPAAWAPLPAPRAPWAPPPDSPGPPAPAHLQSHALVIALQQQYNLSLQQHGSQQPAAHLWRANGWLVHRDGSQCQLAPWALRMPETMTLVLLWYLAQ